MEACDNGTATWALLGHRAVDAGTFPGFGSGNACIPFGLVRIPRTVGFRFRFRGDTGIAKAESDARNFTWK